MTPISFAKKCSLNTCRRIFGIMFTSPVIMIELFQGIFSGKIDDVKVYNYARSPQQIKEDYNAGFGTYFK